MVKVRALHEFEKYTDKERGKKPIAGEEWETSEERAAFLVQKGVCEYVKQEQVEVKEETKEIETVKEEKPKKTTKKKTTKKN